MASRPTLALSRKSPLKSKKAGKKATKQPWVDTINDLDIYKPSKDAIEAKKSQRKSHNKTLAKISLTDRRAQQDPVRQRQVQQQIMLSYQTQPTQNVEAILARSEQVMGICQGIINGGMITPTPTTSTTTDRLQPVGGEDPEVVQKSKEVVASGGTGSGAGGRAPEVEEPPSASTISPPQYMNSAALSEIAGELLVTVRELREELIQEREARERLEKEVLQQRELLVQLSREVVRLQMHCATDSLQQTRIV